jgi:serine O-acetyltransferase
MQATCQVAFHCVLPPQATIGRDTQLGYRGLGVIIHKKAVVGANVLVGPGVTIGGRSGHAGLPVIGDDVFIGTGAKILGPITIGGGSIIGANAVVISDVPPRSVAAGVPASIIRSEIDVEDLATLPRSRRLGAADDVP